MGLRHEDLKHMVYDIFEVDSFSSKMGEDEDIVVLSFSMRDKAPADDLVKFLSDKLAAFKIPALIKFMDSNLPLVASGKFDKPALREIFTQE